MQLWNIVLSGYPGSGKTVLARRLISENQEFVRLSVDDLRSMYYGVNQPPRERDEEFVYNTITTLRDSILRSRRSVVIDSTAPRNSTREILLDTKVQGATKLLVVMIVQKHELEGRNQERGMAGATAAWDKVWENPIGQVPIVNFRNNSLAEFETSYYVLTELLASKVHPFKRKFLKHIYPRISR
jgi:predicted kinase